MKKSVLVLSLVGAAAFAMLGFTQASRMLTIHLGNQVVTKRAQVIDGVVYAPVDDLLKPFDYRSTRQGNRIDLVPISGVAQRDGVSGSAGVLIRGRTCSINVEGIRPLSGYGEEWLEVYGTLTSPTESTFNLHSAVAVLTNGRQVQYTLSASEMGGEVYAPLNPGETVNFKIQFKKDADLEIERVVLTFANNINDIRDVFRIRIKN